jgi:hypothetical protein
MNLKNIFSILLLALFLSCERNEALINSENLLLGSWIAPSYDLEATTYKRGILYLMKIMVFLFQKTANL